VTGCGCLILIAVLIGGIVFMIFGSTDPGEPIAQAVTALLGLALLRMTLVPARRGLVRARRA
jgi:hypothetical protein